MARGGGTPVELKGNALRVYLHVLKHGPCELRDIQHALGLSTPSLASYHLGKLAEAGYVTQAEDGKYKPLRDVSVEILAGYSRVGAVIVPQQLFFALLFTIITAYFAYRTTIQPAFLPYLIASAGGCVAVLWYETVRLWRRLASWG